MSRCDTDLTVGTFLLNLKPGPGRGVYRGGESVRVVLALRAVHNVQRVPHSEHACSPVDEVLSEEDFSLT